ncbi:MAG: ABC transporter permease [Clostridia bacterium]|nr:ABC transporter permease [Clostridia bacterium]
MKRYFYLQLKRGLRVFPFILLTALIILTSVVTVFLAVQSRMQNGEENQRFKIAITGDLDDKYSRLGLAVLQNFDDTRFAIDLTEMTADEAESQLKKGMISAYVILPENFIERALSGDVDRVTYVTSAGGQNVVSMFKNEFTALITDMIVHSEKGTYAIYSAVKESGLSGAGKHMDELCMEYVDLIFSRSKVMTVEQLGISQGVSTAEYYVCGLTVFLLMLLGITFVTVCVRSDLSLNRLLVSKGSSALAQTTCEFAAHYIILSLLIAVMSAVGSVALAIMGKGDLLLTNFTDLLPLFARIFVILLMISGFNTLMFELSGNMVSAVLFHFFASIGLCYISGCFYPIYSLPLPLQKLSHFLPTGIAREYLEGYFVGDTNYTQLVGILIFTVGFLAVTHLIRSSKTSNRRWHYAKTA